ncbi:hypothetical protein Y032_0009g781 [Ancylostoma ceylanicum]|uniref:Uncharacterized protein n=1 Tax=Ancylostoma ceylanicum TaxID=53326 RepID=A0A016VJV6_9BILA|nr:hypothetical protein Y032_0009g781 [Ancylostoma ceylanicum]
MVKQSRRYGRTAVTELKATFTQMEEKEEKVGRIQKLYPFEALETDYYMGDEGGGGVGRDSEEELSSDDELQQELCKLAGIKRDCVQKRRKEKPVRSEFEMDMEYELDQLITDYANEHLSGNRKREKVKAVSAAEFVKQCQQDEMPALVGGTDDEDEEEQEKMEGNESKGECSESVPSKRPKLEVEASSIKAEEMDVVEAPSGTEPSSSSMGPPPVPASAIKTPDGKSGTNEDEKKHVTFDESTKKEDDESNPIKKAAKQTMEDVKKELPDYYDPDEDDDNERWMQRERKRTTGMGEGAKKGTEARPRIDGNSDAVLSCPGCMVMLTRDCQRHEIYSGQYR